MVRRITMAEAKKSPVSALQKKQAEHVRAIAQVVAKKSVPVEKLRLMIQAAARKLEEAGFGTLKTSYKRLSFEIYVMQRLYEGGYPLQQGNHEQLVTLLDASAEPHAEDIAALEEEFSKPKDPSDEFLSMFD
jgi:hypothetical protein